MGQHPMHEMTGGSNGDMPASAWAGRGPRAERGGHRQAGDIQGTARLRPDPSACSGSREDGAGGHQERAGARSPGSAAPRSRRPVGRGAGAWDPSRMVARRERVLGFNPRFGGKSVTLGQTGVGSRV